MHTKKQTKTKTSSLPLKCIRQFVLCLGFTCLFLACKNQGETEAGFSDIQNIHADSIPIHEILKPYFYPLFISNWNAVGDKAVIMNAGSNDSLVYVYRLPDFEFLYAGIRAGNGPEDLGGTYYSVVSRENDSLMLFWSYSTPGRGMYATLTDTGFVMGNKILESFKRISADIPATDSLVVDYRYGDTDRSLNLLLCDLKRKGWIDSLNIADRLLYQERHEKYRSFFVYQNIPSIIGKGTVYAVVYPLTGRVEFYDVSTGKFVLNKTIPGNNIPMEELEKMDLTTLPWYYQIASDGKYLYILEYVLHERELADCYILVYDWQGNLVGKYHPDKFIHTILAYQGKIYGYNKDLDFEQVYVFDLGL